MTGSKVDVAKARRMRAAGASLQEIGTRYGVTGERIRQLVVDVALGVGRCAWCDSHFDKCTSNQRYCSRACGSKASDKAARIADRDECPQCGGSKRSGSALCRSCCIGNFHAREKDAQLVDLWAKGHTMAEIAGLLGITKGSLSVRMVRLRRKGADLPYRRNVLPGGSPAHPELVRGDG